MGERRSSSKKVVYTSLTRVAATARLTCNTKRT